MDARNFLGMRENSIRFLCIRTDFPECIVAIYLL